MRPVQHETGGGQVSAPITVLIVAYHGDAWLPSCLSSLATAGQNVLTILVDNSGNTNLARYAQIHGLSVVATPRPMGFADGNNFGLVDGPGLGKAVIFLNQDTVSVEGWIDACMSVLDERPDIGAVTPLIRTYDDGAWDPSFIDCIDRDGRERLLAGKPLAGGAHIVKEAPAAALVVRTEALLKAGPFDPIYGSYYEDYDLCRRIREAGYQIAVCNNARIRHYSGSATKTSAQVRHRMRQLIRNRAIHEIRSYRGNRAFKFVRIMFVDMTIRFFRSLLRTSSSQPVNVIIGSWLDLANMSGRLVSSRRDAAEWASYLCELGWPHVGSGSGAKQIHT